MRSLWSSEQTTESNGPESPRKKVLKQFHFSGQCVTRHNAQRHAAASKRCVLYPPDLLNREHPVRPRPSSTCASTVPFHLTRLSPCARCGPGLTNSRSHLLIQTCLVPWGVLATSQTSLDRVAMAEENVPAASSSPADTDNSGRDGFNNTVIILAAAIPTALMQMSLLICAAAACVLWETSMFLGHATVSQRSGNA